MVVPVEEQFKLSRHDLALERHHEEPSALILHGLNESLEHRDAPVLADCSESLRDTSGVTPTSSLVAEEWSFLIGDQILGFGSDAMDDAIEQGDDRVVQSEGNHAAIRRSRRAREHRRSRATHSDHEE